ncbi:MAG: cation:proton antiporter [Acidimicrobiales bacterium]
MPPAPARAVGGIVPGLPLLPLSDHIQLVFWAQLALLLLLARLLGGLARRVGQPAVVGELVSGLLLGPSVLGNLWGGGFHWLFPPAPSPSSALLSGVSTLGLAFLLLVVGFETDVRLIRALGRPALAVSAGSLLVPLVAGGAVAAALPVLSAGGQHGRVVAAVLLALAAGISSLPIIAKIVSELELSRRDVGQLALAAGTVNDALGFLALGVATAFVAGGGGLLTTLARTGGGLVLLLAAFAVGGQRVLDLLLRHSRRRDPGAADPAAASSLAVCLVVALALAAASQAIGIDGVLGAFLAGLALGRSRFGQSGTRQRLDALTSNFFAPLYFATAGLRVDVGLLRHGALLAAFVALTVVAALAKLLGSFAGAWVGRLPAREGLALGVALNGRGTLQTVVGTSGLAAGVLGTGGYTVVILLAVVTSMAVPPLLRRTVAGWAGTEAERARLGHEERLARNVVVSDGRILVADQGCGDDIVAAEVLHLAWPRETGATVLSFGEGHAFGEGHDSAAAARPVLDVLGERPLEHRLLAGQRAVEQVLEETRLGYGVVGIGAGDLPVEGHLLSPVVDELLASSPLPVLVVRRAKGLEGPLPPAFVRVLVPLSGGAPSRAAQEVAFNLGARLGARVVLIHVLTRGRDGAAGELRRVRSGGRLAAEWTTRPRDRVVPPAGSGGEDGWPRGERWGYGPQVGGQRGREPAGGGRWRGGDPPGAGDRSPIEVAQRVLTQAQSMAEELGVSSTASIRFAPSPGEEVVQAARDVGADLIVIGTQVRLTEGHPFLGHTVEHVLEHADPTAVVVALPKATQDS